MRIISRGWYLISIVAAVFVLGAGHAQAAQKKAGSFAGFVKYTRDHVHYEINADGTHVETRDWALKVLTEQGVSVANSASISYSDRLEKAEILAAYTLKKDGRRINVPPSNFQEEINKGKANASPMFSDIRTKTVAFPEVAVGDTVVLAYKLTQHEATFPGNFSMIETFSKFEVYDDVQVSMSAPASLPLKTYARGVQGGEVAQKNGRRNWVWSYQNNEITVEEPGAVSSLDYGPLVVASTFKDYGAIASAYDARAKDKAVPTARVRKLADDLTKDAKTPREQAKALYDWVAKNIEYAGNCVGVGSVVPHPAEMVLTNRMGDCKDHTALLQALLAAKGIDSTPVLISSGSGFTLPEVPSTEPFNHVIVYIPSLKLYADPTSRYTSFGRLPESDCDKPVIHTASFNGIQHTPAIDWHDNGSEYDTVINLHDDGSAEGETRVMPRGRQADATRYAMSYLQPNYEDTMMRQALASRGYTGSATLVRPDPKKSGDAYSYSVKFKLSDAINLPGPGAMPIKSPFGSNLLASEQAAAQDPDRTVNFVCTGDFTKEKFTIHFPKSVKVEAAPKTVQYSSRLQSYSATYHLEGNTLTVVREFDDHTPGNVCKPADSAEYKSFAPKLIRDLRAQVVYQ